MGVRKIEFETKTQFLYSKNMFFKINFLSLSGTVDIISWYRLFVEYHVRFTIKLCFIHPTTKKGIESLQQTLIF